MNDKLTELENNLNGQSRASKFSKTELLIYPETFRQIHSYNLFGENLLSIPANLMIEGDKDEFEKPFVFTDNIEVIKLFEIEFRQEISNDFVQIGNLYGSTEIVLLNKLKDTVHMFHVSDISDLEWLNYKLDNPKCDLKTFIENIRLQSVCCLLNPKDFSEYEILEIRNKIIIKTEELEKECENIIDTWKEYLRIIKNSINKGYKIHYAPKKVIDELNNKSSKGCLLYTSEAETVRKS